MSSPNDCSTQVNVGPPVLYKFRTGSYLIYDDPADSSNDPTKEPKYGPTNFRQGTDLADTPFRASGSHQLDSQRLASVLKPLAPSDGKLFLVDLREETHVYFDIHAVSWYANNDFANVGQPLEWIVADEKSQLDKIAAVPVTRIFCITEEDKQTGNVTPTGYSDVRVKLAATEKDVAATFPFPTNYLRIPVTDHCMPSEEALNQFVDLCKSLNPDDWVHCHCHGGDGRTTTFLTLFDMIHWAKTNGTTAFPTLEDFACRQCQIFSYCLNPYGCPEGEKCATAPLAQDWKYYLALERWLFLDLVRTWIIDGGLNSGTPFRLPDDWSSGWRLVRS